MLVIANWSVNNLVDTLAILKPTLLYLHCTIWCHFHRNPSIICKVTAYLWHFSTQALWHEIITRNCPMCQDNPVKIWLQKSQALQRNRHFYHWLLSGCSLWGQHPNAWFWKPVRWTASWPLKEEVLTIPKHVSSHLSADCTPTQIALKLKFWKFAVTLGSRSRSKISSISS